MPRCIAPGCTKQPCFGEADDKKASYCKSHAPEHFVDVRNKCRCITPECTKRASYGNEGDKKATYCKPHAPDYFVNIVSDRCVAPGCTTFPVFGNGSNSKATYCKQHAPEHFVDVKNRHCLTTGCTTRPTYGNKGDIRAIYCKSHAPTEFVDMRHAHCISPGCTKRPSFGSEGDARASYCKSHAPAGFVDIMNKRCVAPGCVTRPNFGIPGQSPTTCAQHQSSGMIANPRRKCEAPDCKQPAVYGIGSAPTHCEEHRTEHQNNLVHHECIVCSVLEIVDADGKCSRCSEYLRKRLHCRKQKELKCIFERSDLPDLSSYDRIIDGGACGKERPDFVWDCGTHHVVVECDESQHNTSPCECEQARMVNVTGSFGTPVFWIRYNPDTFSGEWSTLKQSDRHDMLLKTIKDCLSRVPISYCLVTHLFFDGFKRGHSIVWDAIPMI